MRAHFEILYATLTDSCLCTIGYACAMLYATKHVLIEFRPVHNQMMYTFVSVHYYFVLLILL